MILQLYSVLLKMKALVMINFCDNNCMLHHLYILTYMMGSIIALYTVLYYHLLLLMFWTWTFRLQYFISQIML